MRRVWHEMISMRNRLIHEYDTIDLRVVWQVLQDELPVLIAQIEPLIPPEDELDDQADGD